MASLHRCPKGPQFLSFFLVLALMTGAVVLSACGGGGGSGGGSPAGPTITLLSPSNVMVGVPQGLVDVYGSNFTKDAKVLVNGAAVNSNFHDSSMIEAQLNISDYTVPGVYDFQVTNSVGTSNKVSFNLYYPAQGPQTLSALPGYTAGSRVDPSAVAVADIDGDGLADVVLPGPTMANGPTIAILKGESNGMLAAPRYISGFAAYGLVVGDISGDGYPDLVVASSAEVSTTQITVLSSDGRGNFTQTSTQALKGIYPGWLKLADVFGSGRQDLLFSANQPSVIYLLRNQGDGSFAPAQSIANVDAGERSFGVGDFNDDGHPDIVYTGDNVSTGAPEIHILFNQGNGAFNDVAPAGLAGIAGVVTVGDFNLDKCSDLAVQTGATGSPVTLDVFLSACDGTFVAMPGVAIAPGGFAAYNLVVGDFDHDGFPDMGGVNGETEPSHILYLWGDGHGHFTPQAVVGPEGAYDATGDVNGDGRPDIVVPDRFNEVSVALGRNDRHFPSPDSLSPPNAGAISAGDVNRDGLPDLFFRGNPINGVPGSIFLNQGNGEFVFGGDTSYFGEFLADLNGDGFADLVGADGATLLIWPGNGDATSFQGAASITMPASFTPADLQTADLDGDGYLDLVAPGVVLYGRGNFQFGVVSLAFDAPFAIGDFNGDGRLDLATPAVTLLNQGNRTFQSIRSNLNISASAGDVPAAGDFNGDGRDDVAYTNNQYVEIAYGKGDGTFYLQGALAGEQPPGGIVVADFNGDGRPDVATGLEFAHQMVLYTNDGHGKFDRSYFASGVDTSGMVEADFNKDGRPDLAILNFMLNFRPPNAVVVLNQ